jgi:hypothetical protein
MDENRSDPTEQIAPVELAILAALINPTACQSGNSRDTLLQALALFEESATICNEMAPRSFEERIELLEIAARSGSTGARRLLGVLVQSVLNVPPPFLTLAVRDEDSDTVRPYLASKLSLEGKTGRKVWSRTRTVHDNLRLMYIDRANQWNRDNAARIRAHERQAEEQARDDSREAEERGFSVGLISRFRPPRSSWRDGLKEFEELMSRCEVKEQGRVHHYDIPQVVIDEFVKWKREIRQKGGIKAIRPLKREEVFGKAVEERNPKRRR